MSALAIEPLVIRGLALVPRTHPWLVVHGPPVGEISGTAGEHALVECCRDGGRAILRFVDPEAVPLGPRALQVSLRDALGTLVADDVLQLELTHAAPAPMWTAKGAPFLAALRHAFAAAGDAASSREVLRALTRAVWSLGERGVRYRGGTFLVPGPGHLWVDEALRILDDDPKAGKSLNCTDCASLICALGSVLGLRVALFHIDDIETAERHWTLGGEEGPSHYVFHDVARAADRVWDGCISVDRVEGPITGVDAAEYGVSLFGRSPPRVPDQELVTLVAGKSPRGARSAMLALIVQALPWVPEVRRWRLDVEGRPTVVSILTAARREVRVDEVRLSHAAAAEAFAVGWEKLATSADLVVRRGTTVVMIRDVGEDPCGLDRTRLV